MKATRWSGMILAAVLTVARPQPGTAQSLTSGAPPAGDSTAAAAPRPIAPVLVSEPPVQFRERDLSGPRVGFTFAAGDRSVRRRMQERGVGPVISQFGWHFEHQVAPLAGGPQLVTEMIPFFGGVEYGKLIPSVTLALGVRLPSGLEFGMGPSFTLVGASGRSNAGLVIAVGKTIDYGGVNIPLNLAVSTNSRGTMTTVSAGYAIRRAAR